MLIIITIYWIYSNVILKNLKISSNDIYGFNQEKQINRLKKYVNRLLKS